MRELLKTFLLLGIFPISLLSQDGRIDTLTTVDNTDTYYLKNKIDSNGIWSVEVIGKIKNASQRSLPIIDTTVEINHSRYENFYLEIQGENSYQYLIKEDTGEKYYVYADIYASPKDGIQEYIKCLYSNVKYPQEAIRKRKEGLTVMRLYINEKGCLDQIMPESKLGFGLEVATKKAIESCDCGFYPSKRQGEPVKAIWIMPMRFKL